MREDPDEVISFGLWEGSAEELMALVDEPDGRARIERMAPFVEAKFIDGIYEVETVEPRRS